MRHAVLFLKALATNNGLPLPSRCSAPRHLWEAGLPSLGLGSEQRQAKMAGGSKSATEENSSKAVLGSEMLLPLEMLLRGC